MDADEERDCPACRENVEETDEDDSENDRLSDGHGERAGTGDIDGEGDESLVWEGESLVEASSITASIFKAI